MLVPVLVWAPVKETLGTRMLTHHHMPRTRFGLDKTQQELKKDYNMPHYFLNMAHPLQLPSPT